jgi:hypothetical protein
MMEPDAAPAAGDERSSRTREAPGTDRGDTTTPPQGACWTGTGANASSQETRTRGTEIAAMARREAPAFSKRERGKTED